MNSLEIGIVVEVNGMISKVATFDDTNHTSFIFQGEIIKNVSVNSFLIISQGVFGKCKMHETAALFVNHLPTSNFSSS